MASRTRLPRRSEFSRAVRATIVLGGLIAAVLLPGFAQSQPASVKIAVAGSLTDFGASAGVPVLNAARLAAEEANADGGPYVELTEYDDRSTEDGAREVARKVASSDAIAVLGPDISIMCLVAGPLYAEAGLASITPTANSDRITTNATSFQAVISTSAMAASLANYLHYVIGGSRLCENARACRPDCWRGDAVKGLTDRGGEFSSIEPCEA